MPDSSTVRVELNLRDLPPISRWLTAVCCGYSVIYHLVSITGCQIQPPAYSSSWWLSQIQAIHTEIHLRRLHHTYVLKLRRMKLPLICCNMRYCTCCYIDPVDPCCYTDPVDPCHMFGFIYQAVIVYLFPP